MNVERQQPTGVIDRPILWEPSLHFLKFAMAFMGIGTLVYLVVLFVLVPEQTWRAVLVFGLLVVTATAWLLLRRGRVESAMWALGIGVWVFATVSSVFLGGVNGPAVVIYPLTILLVGWLVGTRAALVAAALTSGTALVFVVLDALGDLPAAPATPHTLRWIIDSGVWIMTAALIASVARSYRARLEDMRQLDGELNRAQAVAHVGSWVYDLSADRMLLSAETCRIFGLPEGTTGRHDHYLARVHQDDRAAVDHAWQVAVDGGPSFDHEHRIVVGDAVRWVRQVAEFERDSRGRPTRAVGTTQDITDRRQTEEALRLTRIGVENASEALFWIDLDGRFVDVNAAACMSLGYTREELLHLGVLDVDADFSPARWDAHLNELRASVSATFETRHRMKDGRVFDVEVVTTLVRIGTDDRLCAFARNISERKRHDAELLAARRQLQATLDAIPDLLFEVDLDGRYVDWHSPRVDLLAVPPEHFVGRLISEVMPPDVAEECMAGLREADATGRSLGRQFELHLPQGRVWFELSISRKPVAAGQAPGFIVVSRDITERKATEEALRAGEAQLECVLGATADGILAVALDGRVIKTNQRFADLWRIPPELLERQDDRALLEHVLSQLADPDAFLAKVTALYGSSAEDTDTVRFKDGRSFERYSAPLVLKGALMGRVWSFRDVTERNRIEARLAMATEVTQIVFWELDLLTGRLQFDERMLATLRVGDAASLHSIEQWVSNVHADDRAVFMTRITAARQPDGGVFDCEYRTQASSGGYEWLHTRGRVVQRDANGTGVLAVGTSMNVTARKQAEAELRDRDSRLSAVFEASPLPITVTKVSDGTFLDLNEAASRLYGAPRAAMLGQSVRALDLYPHPAQREELLRQLQERGAVDCLPLDIRLRNGDLRTVEAFSRVIALNGEPCLVAMLMDVTERKRLEDAHLQAQKLESLGTLAGGIAHDFNNILGAIRGNVELANELVGPHHPAQDGLSGIRTAATRASELVRRIMVFGSPREARHEAVDLGLVIDEVLRLLRSTLSAGIQLRTACAGDTPRVVADAGQVHEVIVNLTTNAAYAIGGETGTIDYRLEPVAIGEQQVGAPSGLKPGRYVRLTVSDTGCGIDPSRIERIFDAFYTTKPVGEGAGLGLSMVHGIMKSHGGAVTAESAIGRGASFSVYFRAADVAAATTAPARVESHGETVGRRVLFVDDEEALALVAQRMLERIGHTVTACTDPNAALAHFRNHPDDFDVLVTDLSMPGLSGFELSRAVLALRPRLPIVLTTGWVRGQDEAAARDVGIRELVLKPLSMGELNQVIDQLFR